MRREESDINEIESREILRYVSDNRSVTDRIVIKFKTMAQPPAYSYVEHGTLSSLVAGLETPSYVPMEQAWQLEDHMIVT